MSDGIRWFTDPGRVAQKFSTAGNLLGDESEKEVRGIVNEGAEIMRQRVRTGGVKNKEWTGGPRARTWNMFDAIDGKVTTNSRARTQGEVGYLNNAPGYTEYQEGGTLSGILPLQALEMATKYIEVELENAAGRILERVWNNMWSR